VDLTFPLFMNVVAPNYDRSLSVQLAGCEAMLWVILDHLGKKLTPEERVSSPLGKLLAADNRAEIEQMVGQVNEQMKTNRKDLVILKLRELTGITWDDLHLIVDRWKEMTSDQQKHLFRLARVYQAYREAVASKQLL
jgi:hypothetical protein